MPLMVATWCRKWLARDWSDDATLDQRS